MSDVSRVLSTGCTLLTILVVGINTAAADDTLSNRIAASSSGATVPFAPGQQQQPLTITQDLVLRGTSAEDCILQVTADRPALSITGQAKVTLKNITIQWQLETSDPMPGPPTAVLVKDADLTLSNCRIIARGNGKRCPSGILADGFSKLSLENCTLQGFEFTVNVSGGAEASVSDCLLRSPGHCGLSVFSDSQLTVTRCIVAESAYHALRSTGGTLTATDNLILHNKNRGIYLGNKSAKATIRGNVFLANTTGISAFARTTATIEHNVFLDAEYAAIDSRESCQLKIAGNIFQGNKQGLVLFSDSGTHQLDLGVNTFWKNTTDTKDIEQPESSLMHDPQLADPAHGRFAATADTITAANQGLADAAPIQKLWQQWESVTSP